MLGKLLLARPLFALALVMACSATCHAAIDNVDLPEEFSVAPMAQRLRLNGLPLEIQILATPLPAQRACALIAGRWIRIHRAALLGCRQSGGWTLVSLWSGSRELTVQLRPAPLGSRGYLSSIDLLAPPTMSPRPRVPMPPGAEVRSVLQSSGPDGDTVQFTIGWPVSPPTAMRRLREFAGRFGWTVSAPAQSWSSGGTLDMRRGNELARGLITRDSQGTGLVLVESALWQRQP